jgi:hypothetical protein
MVDLECMWRAVRNAYRILVRTFQEKIPLRIHKQGRQDNIALCLRDVGCEDSDWTHIILGGVQ